MSGIRIALLVFFASTCTCVFNGQAYSDDPRPEGLRPARSSPELSRPLQYNMDAKPEDLGLESCSVTHSPERFGPEKRFKEFRDPEDIVKKGPITKIEAYISTLNPMGKKAELIHGIRLYYGGDGAHGDFHGYTQGMSPKEWIVPKGERITLVKGEYLGPFLCRLQFVTDRGTRSPEFAGMRRGDKSFEAEEKSGGELRTISGWVDAEIFTVSRPASNPWARLFGAKDWLTYYPAIRSMTFYFNAPYFIRKIEYDQTDLEALRLQTNPEVVHSAEYNNDSSVELRPRKPFEWQQKVTRSRMITFKNSSGLTFTKKVSLEASGSLEGIGINRGRELSWENSVATESGEAFTDTIEDTVAWSSPIVVPPRSTVICRAVWRQRQIKIPFFYTVAWYQGGKEKIVKEVRLPGVYEDTDYFDLRVDIKEVPLKKTLP